jgi:biuret amidohydrolase
VLRAIVPTRRVLTVALAAMLVIHIRDGHRPDLADLNAAKRECGRPETRIGDCGPMGRILIRGEPGHDIIPKLAPISGEWIAREGRHAGNAQAVAAYQSPYSTTLYDRTGDETTRRVEGITI